MLKKKNKWEKLKGLIKDEIKHTNSDHELAKKWNFKNRMEYIHKIITFEFILTEMKILEKEDESC